MDLSDAYANRKAIQVAIVPTFDRSVPIVPINTSDEKYSLHVDTPTPRVWEVVNCADLKAGESDWLFEEDSPVQSAMRIANLAMAYDRNFHALTLFQQQKTISFVRSQMTIDIRDEGLVEANKKIRYTHVYDELESYRNAMLTISQSQINLDTKIGPVTVVVTCIACGIHVLKSPLEAWDFNDKGARLKIKIGTRILQDCEIPCLQKVTVGLTAIVSLNLPVHFDTTQSMQALFVNHLFYSLGDNVCLLFG